MPTQLPRKFRAVASPKVWARRWLLGYSAPTIHAYGPSSSNNRSEPKTWGVEIPERLRPTEGSVKESKDGDETDYHLASGLGSRSRSPSHGKPQLREPADSNPDHEDSPPIHLVCPKETRENPEKTHAGYHG